IEDKWEQFTDVRDEIFKALEAARKDKVIGTSLAASVRIYPDNDTYELLQQLGRLDHLLIVSHVDVADPGAVAPEDAMKLDGLAVKVVPAEGDKCERCWNVTPEVGQNEKHPSICARCADVIEN